jgi:hypothetical protein
MLEGLIPFPVPVRAGDVGEDGFWDVGVCVQGIVPFGWL